MLMVSIKDTYYVDQPLKIKHIFFHCLVAVTIFFGSPMGCRFEKYLGLNCKQIMASWLAEKGNHKCLRWIVVLCRLYGKTRMRKFSTTKTNISKV